MIAGELNDYSFQEEGRWSWDGAGPPSRRGSMDAMMQNGSYLKRSMPKISSLDISKLESALEMTWMVRGPKPASDCLPPPEPVVPHPKRQVTSISKEKPTNDSFFGSSCCTAVQSEGQKCCKKCCDDEDESPEDGLVTWFCIPISRSRKKDDRYKMVTSLRDFYIEY